MSFAISIGFIFCFSFITASQSCMCRFRGLRKDFCAAAIGKQLQCKNMATILVQFWLGEVLGHNSRRRKRFFNIFLFFIFCFFPLSKHISNVFVFKILLLSTYVKNIEL